MLGLSDSEWKELKDQQYELNCRRLKILEMTERKNEKGENWCDFCEGICKCMLRQKNGAVENNFTKKDEG